MIKNFWNRFNYLFHLALSIFDCDTHKAKFADNIGGISFFDREIAQALAVLQVAIVSIDFKRFVYTDLDD